MLYLRNNPIYITIITSHSKYKKVKCKQIKKTCLNHIFTYKKELKKNSNFLW